LGQGQFETVVNASQFLLDLETGGVTPRRQLNSEVNESIAGFKRKTMEKSAFSVFFETGSADKNDINNRGRQSLRPIEIERLRSAFAQKDLLTSTDETLTEKQKKIQRNRDRIELLNLETRSEKIDLISKGLPGTSETIQDREHEISILTKQIDRLVNSVHEQNTNKHSRQNAPPGKPASAALGRNN